MAWYGEVVEHGAEKRAVEDPSSACRKCYTSTTKLLISFNYNNHCLLLLPL